MQEYMDFAAANPMLVIAWFGLAGALIFTTVKSRFSAVTNVTHQQATLMMNKEDAVIVDVRSLDEFKKGHIVGAKHLTESQINAGTFTGVENLKESPIIVVCATGMRSSGAANKLVKAGFTQVSNLTGGIAEWKNANLPLTKK
ncbi:rhodanese-like domain-containing protein [Motilimonas sp. E26]|uniref:rhodanese-like domain-containing protein n=1 Tax=Motilimonas TaxID=1914248 RepID=UPI001E53FFAA|nr:rhodanese-like domain-containing protein [Motilimonas sp. E26]MCE0557351.1 rhodanese-like domain-containing protein [Motilimonas sp. E26]